MTTDTTTTDTGTAPRITPHAPTLASRVTGLVAPSAFGAVLGEVHRDAIALTGGSPATEALPREGLIEATAAVLRDPARAGAALDYSAHQGHAGLRTWIAGRESRDGASVDPSRVVITNGALHALSLVFLATVDPGDTVVVEDPYYPLVAKVLQLSGARIEAVPIEADGLDVDELERRLQAGLRPRALYVVPDFHNPTGRVLAPAKRVRLTELAEHYGFLIVSDNPYTELRGTGERLADFDVASDRVARVNTFSKTLGPGLRLGWAVLPEWIVPGFLDLRSRLDQHASSLGQATVAEYLGAATPTDAQRADHATGTFDRLVAAASVTYRARSLAFAGALRDALGDAVEIDVPDGGVFAWPRFTDDRVDVAALAAAGARAGVVVLPGSQFAVSAPGAARHVRASFGQHDEATLLEAVARFAAAHAEVLGGATGSGVIGR